MGQRKIRIDRDRTLVERQGPYRAVSRFVAGAVGLQRFERRRRRILERHRVSLDGGERFANSRSEPRRHLAECAQHIFFPRRLCLLVGEDVPGRAVGCAQPEDVLAAKRRNRSLQDRRTARPNAHDPRNVGGQSCIRRLVHQWQRSSDALVGDQAEERRLLELHRKALSQRFVEHRIAGRVGELSEHDAVLVGERSPVADRSCSPQRPERLRRRSSGERLSNGRVLSRAADRGPSALSPIRL